MQHKYLTRAEFNRINQMMAVAWERAFREHFGDDILIGKAEELPSGQLWEVMAEILVSADDSIQREILSFGFPAHEYFNATLDTKRFYAINDTLARELAELIAGPNFEPARKQLAEEVYQTDRGGYIPYGLTIWAFLKGASGKRGLSDGLLHFSVNCADPDDFQLDLIGHGSASSHFTYVPRTFLSHSAADKPRLAELVAELRNAGIQVWIDEAELEAGDSLKDKLRPAIQQSDIVIGILTTTSVKSDWVKWELNAASGLEIDGNCLKVVLVLLDDVALPEYVADRLFIDLRDPREFRSEVGKLLRAAEARFWRMRSPMTYADADALQQELRQWKLPSIAEAENARTAMIYSEIGGYNDPFWTATWEPGSDISFALEGIEKREYGPIERKRKLHCVLVPRS
jgi:hypothetical protein